jgi:hypothetical protein
VVSRGVFSSCDLVHNRRYGKTGFFFCPLPAKFVSPKWIPVSIPVVANSANIQMVQVNGSNTLNWHVASYQN